jgi:hypothetical protein
MVERSKREFVIPAPCLWKSTMRLKKMIKKQQKKMAAEDGDEAYAKTLNPLHTKFRRVVPTASSESEEEDRERFDFNAAADDEAAAVTAVSKKTSKSVAVRTSPPPVANPRRSSRPNINKNVELKDLSNSAESGDSEDGADYWKERDEVNKAKKLAAEKERMRVYWDDKAKMKVQVKARKQAKDETEMARLFIASQSLLHFPRIKRKAQLITSPNAGEVALLMDFAQSFNGAV